MSDTITINKKNFEEIFNKLNLHLGFCHDSIILLENYDTQNDTVLSGGISIVDRFIEMTQNIANELWLVVEEEKKTNNNSFLNLKIGIPQEFIEKGTIVPLSKTE